MWIVIEFECLSKNGYISVEEKNVLKNQSKVYFTCHPDDISYLESISKDIFKTQDCIISHTKDMSEPIEEPELEFKSFNLFIVPVTRKLLESPSRARDFDIKFADENDIPILPFMMEPFLDRLYGESVFGDRQFLDPFSFYNQVQLKSYAEVLEIRLSTLLYNDKVLEKVRNAFDGYMFLSYRHDDRKVAVELIKLIHKEPELRDLAIWFDEYIIPGKSFNSEIRGAMEKSKLFMLVVTPNLIKDRQEGEIDYIIDIEYDEAKNKLNMEILPTEMEKTDHIELERKFRDLPLCIDPQNDPDSLRNALVKLTDQKKDKDKEHNYLMGLAYLYGIDVEIDSDRAISLITSAANGGLDDAMEKLVYLYLEGNKVKKDYDKALKWAERFADHREKTREKFDIHFHYALLVLLNIYISQNRYKQAFACSKKLYAAELTFYGRKERVAILSLEKVAWTCLQAALNEKNMVFAKKYLRESYKYYRELYELEREVFGPQNPDTLITKETLQAIKCRI